MPANSRPPLALRSGPSGTNGRVVLLLCSAHALTLIGVFAFPALIPTFRQVWGLSNIQAGWISGIYFLGYALAVPVLTSLTDRIDAKKVFLAGAALCALASAGFAGLADGAGSAMLFRFLGGVGLAGCYMPGLKALVDRVTGPFQARAISFYTASFSLGTMLSFALVGEAEQWIGWRGALALTTATAVAGLGLAALLPPAVPQGCSVLRFPPSFPRTRESMVAAGTAFPKENMRSPSMDSRVRGNDGGRILSTEQPWAVPRATTAPADALLDFRPILRNRTAMGYILGYVCHMWELFTFRAWVVAFLAFVQSRNGASAGWSPTTVATLCSLAAMLASVGGADLALRFSRPRLCAFAMLASGGTALGLGLTAWLPYAWAAAAAVVYSALVQIDSAALTTGAMLAAEEHRRGATVALHSLLGFGAAFFGPLTQGWLLDVGGGAQRVSSWVTAFAAMGAVGLLGPLALAWSRRSSDAVRPS